MEIKFYRTQLDFKTNFNNRIKKLTYFFDFMKRSFEGERRLPFLYHENAGGGWEGFPPRSLHFSLRVRPSLTDRFGNDNTSGLPTKKKHLFVR